MTEWFQIHLAVFVVVNNKAEGSSPLSVFRLAQRLAAWEPAAPDAPSAP